MKITINTVVKSDIDTVWEAWNSPEHIVQWNAASDDWHTTESQVDLKVGGKFCSRMEAKDGSVGFDFEGTYIELVENELIRYQLEDERLVSIEFREDSEGVYVSQVFDAENEMAAEQQKEGWQSILNKFARYVGKHC